MGFDIDFGNLQQPNPFAAYAQGQDIAARQAQRKASAQAGQQLASGNRQGAMQSLGSVGMVDDVRQLQNDQEGQEAHTKAEEIRAQHERGQALMTVAQGLKRIPAGSRKAALDNVMPVFEQLGIDPAMFGKLSEDQLTDQNLDIFSGNVESHLQGVNLGGGGYGTFDTQSGEFKTVREPTAKPVVIGNGAVALDPETGEPIYRNPKTFAPPRARSGGGGGSAPAASGSKPWERKW